jgi:hypothetical protein
MIEFNPAVAVMDDADLLACTRELARKSCLVESELLLHLGEIEARNLHAERAYPSMFAFCMKELGFSEGAAYNRIFVARAARRLPQILGALGSGRVHLAGLRLLVPHLTEENCDQVLAEAAGKSKREIEELVARLAPQPSVPDVVRKLPARAAALPLPEAAAAARTVSAAPIRPEAHRPDVAPLSADTFKIEFTGSREMHDKLRQAQDLLRHRVPSGHLAIVFEKALDALIANLLKERFGVGRKPRRAGSMEMILATSPHIPIAIKREVYLRDEGRCAFVAEDGRRCCETGGLEFDHIDGFAQTHVHDAARIRLACRAHNQHTAEQLYGRVFMERLREAAEKGARRAVASTQLASDIPSPTRPERTEQQALFSFSSDSSKRSMLDQK